MLLMLPRPEPDTENPAHEEPGGLREDPIAIGLRLAAMLTSSIWCWLASDVAGRAARSLSAASSVSGRGRSLCVL